EELRVRRGEEELWRAITSSVCGQFEPPGRKGEEVRDAGRWMERIRVIFTEPAIHGEVLKASASAQSELAKAIAERIGSTRANELYPQLVAAGGGAVGGVVSSRWLRDGPVRPNVPLMGPAMHRGA